MMLSHYAVYRKFRNRIFQPWRPHTSCLVVFRFVVIQELLKASTCQLRLGTRVTGVVGSAKEGYSVYGAGQEQMGTFDAVIIAAPIGLAAISLDVRKEVLAVIETFMLLMAGGLIVQKACRRQGAAAQLLL